MLFILDLRPSVKICAQYHIVKHNGHIGTVTELFNLLEKTSLHRFIAIAYAHESMKKSQSSFCSRLSLLLGYEDEAVFLGITYSKSDIF